VERKSIVSIGSDDLFIVMVAAMMLVDGDPCDNALDRRIQARKRGLGRWLDNESSGWIVRLGHASATLIVAIHNLSHLRPATTVDHTLKVNRVVEKYCGPIYRHRAIGHDFPDMIRRSPLVRLGRKWFYRARPLGAIEGLLIKIHPSDHIPTANRPIGFPFLGLPKSPFGRMPRFVQAFRQGQYLRFGDRHVF
jgi:hypothetical protein